MDMTTNRKRREHVASEDGPRPVDVHVGSRIRLRRIELGLSQTELADKVGVSFQQLQKYENGKNRVSASRLYAISQKLKSPIAWFFEGVESGVQVRLERERATIELVRAFSNLSPQEQDTVLLVAKAFGATPSGSTARGG